MVGFENNLVQMTIMIKQCVINKNVVRSKVSRECVVNKKHVASSKFKVIDHTSILFIGYNKSLLYPAHNFILHGGISKLHNKTSVAREDHVASLKVKIIILTYAVNRQ